MFKKFNKKPLFLIFLLFAVIFVLFFSTKSNYNDQSLSKKTRAKVVKIIDGDSITLENGQNVRYIGIDATELYNSKDQITCKGEKAKQINKDLVEGKIIEMEKDITDKDKYGRLLRYVWVNGIFVNEYLVSEGLAYSSAFPPDTKYQNLFDESQISAKKELRGIWGDLCKKT